MQSEVKVKTVLLVLLAAGVALAGEFLGIVPGAEPEDLAREFRVVGQMRNGVLVVGSSGQAPAGGRVLDPDVSGSRYLRVHLLAGASEAELASVSRILDFDGSEYVVAVRESEESTVRALRAMVGVVNLSGWTLAAVPPELPRVMSDPMIEEMVALVSPDTVLSFVRRLQQYRNRYSTGDSCKAAAQWVAAKLRAWGCDTVILQNHTTNHAPNVIGIRYGTNGQRNPYAIISGHLDSYAASNAPGADDNASGTVAAMEACRVMAGFEFERDLKFIAWTGEEFGLYGSEYYADRARSQGDSILAVLNFDMIGYEDVSPEDVDLMAKIANPPCEPLADWFIATADTYTTLPCNKQMMSDNQNSDHGPFWNNGYLALTGIEDFWPGNPHYHTSHDSIGAGYNNNAFCTNVTRAGVAALATLGRPVPMNRPMVSYKSSRLTDVSGNNNGRWDPGESVAVYVTLRNAGTVAAHNVNATIATSDPYVTLYRATAAYGDIAGQDTAVNAQPYLMRASSSTPREHVVAFTMQIVAQETTWNSGFSLLVGEIMATDPIPDGPRTPPRYWAYDDIDTGYAQRPTYSWVEISGSGTRLNYAHNDQVITVNLPSGFGPFKFYGQRYTQVSISADGFVVPGTDTTRRYTNQSLPGTQTPPGVLCANWDDLYPGDGGAGYVYWYHDAANHRFVVEYDSVPYYNPRSLKDKFEVLLYDTTVTTPTGDNAVVMQYRTANGFTSSTVGVEDPTQQIAIQCLYNGSLTKGAGPVVAGRAVKYVTVEPTGIAEMPKPERRLANSRTTIVRGTLRLVGLGHDPISENGNGSCPALLLDASGRKVMELHAGDNDVRGLAPGVYFVTTKGPRGQGVMGAESGVTKVLLVR